MYTKALVAAKQTRNFCFLYPNDAMKATGRWGEPQWYLLDSAPKAGSEWGVGAGSVSDRWIPRMLETSDRYVLR